MIIFKFDKILVHFNIKMYRYVVQHKLAILHLCKTVMTKETIALFFLKYNLEIFLIFLKMIDFLW